MPVDCLRSVDSEQSVDNGADDLALKNKRTRNKLRKKLSKDKWSADDAADVEVSFD
eukprot:COSAG01_NODE_46243_length_401_cov_16.748344_2_plen_55_part_01